MSGECADCDIGIEPGAVAPSEVAASSASPVEAVPRKPIPLTEEAKKAEETTEAVAEAEVKEEVEKIPEKAEVSVLLGALTSACLLTDDDKREECWKGIEPLEDSREKPLETMKRIINLEGVDNVKKSMGALQRLVEEAEKELSDKT
jgi:hypothetical protein